MGLGLGGWGSAQAPTPFGLEAGAHEAREAEEEKRGGDPEEGRLGEGLVQPTVLVIDGLLSK